MFNQMRIGTLAIAMKVSFKRGRRWRNRGHDIYLDQAIIYASSISAFSCFRFDVAVSGSETGCNEASRRVGRFKAAASHRHVT